MTSVRTSTKTNSATIDQNLNNQFTEYAMQRLVGQRDAYGGVIDEERGRLHHVRPRVGWRNRDGSRA